MEKLESAFKARLAPLFTGVNRERGLTPEAVGCLQGGV